MKTETYVGLLMNINMNYLPKLEFNVKRDPMFYRFSNNNDITEFQTRLEEIVMGDCWAILVDNEAVINYYTDRTAKQRIEDSLLMQTLRSDPSLLFGDAFIVKKDINATFYMFGHQTWFIMIDYNAHADEVSIDYYKSQNYIDAYES
jgi:hypothetical protein